MMKHSYFAIVLLVIVLVGGWIYYQREFAIPKQTPAIIPPVGESEAVAYFAGGCFWCMEADFEKVPGVTAAISGYAGGHVEKPAYADVVTETTGHRETVEVRYDPSRVSYRQLVEYFFAHIDPVDSGGQFVDRGESYTAAIFYKSEEEGHAARAVMQELADKNVYGEPIVTAVLPFTNFYPAEEYHQDYHTKNPTRYSYYRAHSGRDDRLAELCVLRAAKGFSCGLPVPTPVTAEPWKSFVKPDEATLRARLSPLAYKVTQEGGTEHPFDNAYAQNKEEGIYVDVLSGEPLFSSRDKYDSGTGWPSFVRTIAPGVTILHKDNTLFTERTEVKSAIAGSHLGHVFNDGPAPTGERWCMNSAALRFVPRADLEKEGYGEYVKLFTTPAL